MTRLEYDNLLDYHFKYDDESKIIEAQQYVKELETKIKEFSSKQKALTVQVPNEYTNINQDAFNEWMIYKKYKNKGAITKTLNMLNKYDYQIQQDMVDKSIMNEYKGLFEPKITQGQRNNSQIDAALEHNVFDLIEQQAQQEQKELR